MQPEHPSGVRLRPAAAAEFFAEQGLDWRDFRLELLGWLRHLPTRRPAARTGLTLVGPGGRLLSPASVARILATLSSFYQWAIVAELYDRDNPMRRRPAALLALAPQVHRPPAIAAVVERYLRLRLEANLDRPQTVRLAREALRRLVSWLTAHHPQVTSLAQLNRALMEQYLTWLPTYLNKNTGRPLSVTTIAHEINAVGVFCRDTAVWEWRDVPGRPLTTARDVPGRPLTTARDTPRTPETIPRYLPQQSSTH